MISLSYLMPKNFDVGRVLDLVLEKHVKLKTIYISNEKYTS
jgi:hypothetical protein